METDETQDVVPEENNYADLDLEVNEEPDWKAEALKYKSMYARTKEKVQAAAKPTEPLQAEFTLNDEVVDLRLEGYSKDDVKFIMQNGGRKSLEDKNSYVAIALKARKEQAEAEAAANKVNDTSGMSEVERKYTPEQLKNMSLEELKKIVPRA